MQLVGWIQRKRIEMFKHNWELAKSHKTSVTVCYNPKKGFSVALIILRMVIGSTQFFQHLISESF